MKHERAHENGDTTWYKIPETSTKEYQESVVGIITYDPVRDSLIDKIVHSVQEKKKRRI
jgi:ribosomal protein L2